MPKRGTRVTPDEVTREEKVAYVKRQKQTRSHVCHWPGCGKQCKPAYWGCFNCWRRLPKYLQDKIWAAYEVGQEATMTPSREYVAVAREVREWIKVHYPETAKGEQPE
jgi:hypothetical protein